ncbi:1-acyl-sn-glycerol-3-phosphate acyltransferase, partial [bacterium]
VGTGEVPMSGPVILAPNHVSNFDPPALAAACPRGIKIIAKEELFRNPFANFINRSLGAFPVRRGEGDKAAIAQTLALLEEGWVMIMFPEGTRSNGEVLLPLSRGVAMMAKRSGARVVPTAVVGTHILMPKGAKGLKRAETKIVFGEPFLYADTATGRNDRENRELFTAELERRILAICAENGLPLERSEASLEPKTEPRTEPIRSE